MESDNLILENLNLIYLIINKMGLSNKTEYYYDVGLIALIRAARRFDPSKGYTFSTFATKAIQNEILMDIRRNQTIKRKANFNTISLDAAVYQDSDGKEISLMEMIPSDANIEEEILEKERIAELKKAISRILTDREKEILNYYIVHDMTQKEIAKKMNFTQSYISRRLQLIFKKLKEKLVSNENHK